MALALNRLLIPCVPLVYLIENLLCGAPLVPYRVGSLVFGGLQPAAARFARERSRIAVEDKVGEYIPLDLLFTDEKGNQVSLGKFFNKNKPIILTLNYSDCPGLCIAQLDGMVANLRDSVGKDLGDRFEIITVSIDPTEKFTKARDTKAKYVGMLRDTKRKRHGIS